MLQSKPLYLMIAVMMALWVPAGHCCAMMAQAAAGSGTAHVTVNEAFDVVATAPSCHPPAPMPRSGKTPASADSEPCEQGDCSCAAVCPVAPDARKQDPAIVAPAQVELPVPPAALLPRTMLPHTFFDRSQRPQRGVSPPAWEPPSLLALSCQLTL